MSKQIEVLVVGAGPTGLSTALALAQAGVGVRIVDRLAKPTNQSRAALIHARTLEHFERLGIVKDFLAVGVKVHGAAVYGPDHALLMRPSFDHLPTAYPYMLGLEQTETERLLTARLNAAGVEVERGVEVFDLMDQTDRDLVRLRHADGTETTEEVRFVVGCDGAHGATRHLVGLHLEGETLDTTWLTADVRIRWDEDPAEAVAALSPDGIVFAGPMSGDRWRVLLGMDAMTAEEIAGITLADVERIMGERLGRPTPLYDPLWIGPFALNTRMVSKMQVGRVFLAGDAAHIHSPVGGQGMNTGIQDGLNLAWKLALVLRGEAKPELIESYNAERHANAKRLLAKVGPMTHVAALRNPVAQAVRLRAVHLMAGLGATRIMPRVFSMLDVGYPESPIIAEAHRRWMSHGPRAGERAPDAEGLLADGGSEPRRLFELWSGDDRHQLVIFGKAAMGESPLYGIIRILREGTPAPGLVIDSEGQAHDAYDVHAEGTHYLVRPDGVIAFVSETGEFAALREYLAKWFLAA